MKTKLTILVLVTLLSGCGTDAKKDGTPATTDQSSAVNTSTASETTATLLLDDGEAAGQTISAQIDAGISAAAEDQEVMGAALSLTSGDKQASMQLFRECKVDGAQAIVTLRRSAERDRSVDGPVRSLETKLSAYLDETRTWSRDGGNVACADDAKHAALTVNGMQGISLAAVVNEERGRTLSFTNKKNGKSTVRSFRYSLNGTRNLTWTDVTTANGVYTLTKQATSSVSRVLEIQKKDGSTVSVSSTLANASDAPLVIVVERDQTTLAVKSREIQSGTLAATHADGTRVETVFHAVKYDMASGDQCMPVSGKIDGSIFKQGETVASLTYQITFGDSATITFSDGRELDYTPEGCELDDPTDQATEQTSKDQVQAPADAAPAATAE